MKQWVAENSLPDRNLARKAVKCALDELKENNQGVLLSTRALKVKFSHPSLHSIWSLDFLVPGIGLAMNKILPPLFDLFCILIRP